MPKLAFPATVHQFKIKEVVESSTNRIYGDFRQSKMPPNYYGCLMSGPYRIENFL